MNPIDTITSFYEHSKMQIIVNQIHLILPFPLINSQLKNKKTVFEFYDDNLFESYSI